MSSLSTVDRYAEREYQNLFERALITFALARTLNGVISAVQGTELALQPAGVGVTLTPGEVLDPVNDLVERFSWIMLGATLSLGVQQVLLDIGQWWFMKLLVAALALAWLVYAWNREQGESRDAAQLERFLQVATESIQMPPSWPAAAGLYQVKTSKRRVWPPRMPAKRRVRRVFSNPSGARLNPSISRNAWTVSVNVPRKSSSISCN